MKVRLTRFFFLYSASGEGWLRVACFGGVWWKDTSRIGLYFSERNGVRNRHLQIGRWAIGVFW